MPAAVFGQGLSGFRAQTPGNLWVDVGIVWAAIDESFLKGGGPAADIYDQMTANALSLGATRGGAEFDPGKNVAHVEADGVRYPIKGMERVLDYKPTLTVTLLEQTQLNLSKQMFPAKIIPYTSYNGIEPSLEISEDDYVTNIALVGKLTSTDIPIVLVLRDVLVLSNPKYTATDKKEMAVQTIFTAHALPEKPYDAPFTCYYPTTGNLS